MSCIVKAKVGNNTYLYESASYRGADKKPRCHRKIIGKIDPESGEAVYYGDYIQRMAEQGTPVPISDKSEFTVAQIRESAIKKVGGCYLLEKLAERSGLLETLQDVFPDKWRDIFNLACFFVADGEALMNAEDWLSDAEAPETDASSQAISRLFMSLTQNDFLNFYKAWLAKRREKEFLALDITSVSSYSQNIENVEWGYNRDGERLPQINLCLLLGVDSRLPVLQVDYPGSLSDVRTFITTIRETECLASENITLVMDKGFWSRKNIAFLMENPHKERFLISAPFTLKEIKSLVKRNMAAIDRPENTIEDDNTLRLCTEKITLSGKYHLAAHMIYNSQRALQRKNEVFAEAKRVLRLAEKDTNDSAHSEEFERWLTITKQPKTGKTTVEICKSALEAEMESAGWMVLLSNCVDNAEEALRIYRAKDAVEKGFLVYKNDFDLHRMRSHCKQTMDAKLFVGFISLILRSGVHNTMVEKKLYKKMTMKELLRCLDKQKAQYISGTRILYPETKAQRDIYAAFDLMPPV
jgi:transposase